MSYTTYYLGNILIGLVAGLLIHMIRDSVKRRKCLRANKKKE